MELNQSWEASLSSGMSGCAQHWGRGHIGGSDPTHMEEIALHSRGCPSLLHNSQKWDASPLLTHSLCVSNAGSIRSLGHLASLPKTFLLSFVWSSGPLSTSKPPRLHPAPSIPTASYVTACLGAESVATSLPGASEELPGQWPCRQPPGKTWISEGAEGEGRWKQKVRGD